MRVFKFGGASIRDAEAVRNIVEILKSYIGYELVIVVSAMGKTTNKLEKLIREFFYNDGDVGKLLVSIRNYHDEIAHDLFPESRHKVFSEMEIIYDRIKDKCLKLKRLEAAYDFIYDQVVSEGEMLSSVLISYYLNDSGINAKLLDARELIITDDRFREAAVDWDETGRRIREKVTYETTTIYITQGFIGSTMEGHSTTLGREGSDFTAAIFANSLEAKEVVIWKDVPGLLNADPKFFSNTSLLNNISYHEAVELAYFGATVIHPKTIKPLQNKAIPLYVKSFKEAGAGGTIIDENTGEDSLIPSYIFRRDQVLLSISTRDYSFVTEKNLSEIFDVFAKNRIKINLMENSAISFTACFDFDENRLKSLLDALSKRYKVLYNKELELMTVRHYDQPTLDQLIQNKEILVEQKSRHTARLVMKNKGGTGESEIRSQ